MTFPVKMKIFESFAILAATFALAACGGKENSGSTNPPAKEAGAEPQLVNKEPSSEASESEMSGESGNLCEAVGAYLGGAVPVFREGQTAEEAVLESPNLEGLVERGLNEDDFREAIESGQVEFHEQTTGGPKIPADSVREVGTQVGFELKC